MQTWLDEYGDSHKNKLNKAIHWFCVPQIVWTVMVFLYVIPVPDMFLSISPYLNFATITCVLTLLFYSRLSLSLTLGMTVFLVICYLGMIAFEHIFPDLLFAFAILWFAFLWLLQFYGHKVEGKKPSFFKDLQFLMIGPAWLMSFIYQKVGLKY
jgi:uncharacterized membrane protein YGL010W